MFGGIEWIAYLWEFYETESFNLDTDALGKEKQKDVIKRKDGTKCES